MEEAGREGEGMVFKDRDEAVMDPSQWLCSLCIPVSELRRDSLNKPWTEAQQHKILFDNCW